jgi:hypothetical protein
LFIWMQVWILEKGDTPHSFSSRVFLIIKSLIFLIFYSLFGFFIFVKKISFKIILLYSLSLLHLFPFLFYSFCVFIIFFVYVYFMFLFFLFLFCLSSFLSIFIYLFILFLVRTRDLRTRWSPLFL